MRYKLLVALSLAMTPVFPAYAGVEGWKTASDIGAYSLIAVSVGLPALQGDKAGAFQAAGSFGATSLVTEGLKQAFPKTRPDMSDRKSFPSGHTSRSFSAAASLMTRQGAKVGVPAFLVAGFVGLARVEGKKHYWTDVLAGAAIGTSIGFLVTKDKPEETRTAFIPWADLQGGGFTLVSRF
jgi:membrane-associated phospholipid phosphatase